MRSFARSVALGLTALVGALAGGCSPSDAVDLNSNPQEPPKISAKEMKATIAQYNTAATNAVSVSRRGSGTRSRRGRQRH